MGVADAARPPLECLNENFIASFNFHVSFGADPLLSSRMFLSF